MMIEEPPPTPPAPPANAPEPKKGLPPIAWVGIGCGGLLVIAIIAAVIFFAWGASKVTEFAADVQKNPGKAIEMAARFDPNLDVVSTDEAAQTVTVRMNDTGKEVTLSFDDIRQGGLDILTSEGESFSLGAGTATDLPEWIPTYPNTISTQGLLSSSSNEGTNGSFVITTGDAPEIAIREYTSLLEAEGYELSKTTISTGTSDQRMLTAKAENPERTLTIIATIEGHDTNLMVNYAGPPEP
ncbi:hypothetical protein BH23VER1_BH23VER1_27230 [soil metagenome]